MLNHNSHSMLKRSRDEEDELQRVRDAHTEREREHRENMDLYYQEYERARRENRMSREQQVVANYVRQFKVHFLRTTIPDYLNDWHGAQAFFQGPNAHPRFGSAFEYRMFREHAYRDVTIWVSRLLGLPQSLQQRITDGCIAVVHRYLTQVRMGFPRIGSMLSEPTEPTPPTDGNWDAFWERYAHPQAR